ncbi:MULTISPECIES: UDP-N-acetylmuramoyl-tripeptide--D-alanyl-D-alanine ligase [Cohnella]|uniref:UDP-N-acetylmuramoyl-tripeptide--D-alanyl-D- alanine ligase n=1 Tax=Cohnella TaxID=329857 RepID=UPI0009BB0944|nr:UDP-N-acetylmuramoyl-tripeptide--D-alanyl-D-alanine ligase [Cohnella massiliensis]MBN2983369.1 UDP-N-acetylmuramoyl-tripeptide--D-alanyl-D-alanine ligase [Cohnella algarum]
MMIASLHTVADWCGGVRIEGAPGAGQTEIAGVSTDTRSLAPGQLFVPLAGERFDGHDHLRAAEAAGAAAALWQADRPIPPGAGIPLVVVRDTLAALQKLAESYLAGLNARVVGVTGSNGKTTTKDLIASVLATGFKVHATAGNFNNHIGLPLTILRAPADTEAIVLEMGMSGKGEISLLSRLAKPDAAVVTNIGDAHLLQLGSRRNIARAKLEIAEGLKAGGALVYNGDEPLLREELAHLALPEGARLVSFGEGEGCDVRLREAEVTLEGCVFRIADRPDAAFELGVTGRHNAVNALAVVAVGRLFGLGDEQIATGLKSAKLTGMRIERSKAYNGAVVLNDAYNSSPTAVRAAIGLVAQLKGYRKKWIVLSDMLELGPDEAAFHAGIGEALTPDKADALYTVGPLSAHTAERAKASFPEGAVRHFATKRELIEALLPELSPDDLVLVKASRGMKLEEVAFALQKGAVG